MAHEPGHDNIIMLFQLFIEAKLGLHLNILTQLSMFLSTPSNGYHVHHFIPISPKFSLTYLVSLVTFGSQQEI